MDRLIKVTGRGKISVKPDMIRLHIRLENKLDEYAEALRESADRKNDLNSRIEKLGFDKSQLKTVHFDVETVYEGYEAEDHSWKQRFAGYRYNHSMKLEFAMDNDMLGRLLYELAGCEGKPEFNIEYTVKDTDAAKKELLKKAVEDSKEKAEILAEAAGVSLGDIQSINYSWEELDIVARPMNSMKLAERAISYGSRESYSLDIEADDINVTDTVTVIWEIE